MLNVKPESFAHLLGLLEGKEGLVLLGAGGELQDWICGVTSLLEGEKISRSSDPEKVWEAAYVLVTTGGRTDLLLQFKEDNNPLEIGRLAIWKLQFGDNSWWSDYIVNYAKHHMFVPIPEPELGEEI